jgi:two-component system response regulator YesN
MKTIIVVDDEIISRLGIINLMKWEEKGYEIVGDFSTGQSALSFLKNNHVDLIISDISMPLMSGIDLMKTCLNNDIKSQFIFLSAYDDYIYVREALKLGAIDYILKLDLNAEIMSKLLKKVDNFINREPIVTSNLNAPLSLNFVKIEKREHFRQLIYNKLDLTDPLNNEFNSLNYRYVLLTFNIKKDMISSNKEGLFLLIEDVISGYPNSRICMTTINEITIMLVLLGNNISRKIENLGNRIINLVSNFYNEDLIIYISKVEHDITQLSNVYIQIQDMKILKNLNSADKLIYYNKLVRQYENRDYSSLSQLVEILPQLQNESRIEELQLQISKFKDIIKELRYINIRDLKYYLKEIVSLINWVKQIYIGKDSKKDTVLIGQELDVLENRDDINSYLDSLNLKLNQIVELSVGSYLVRNVKNTIQENYKEPILIGNFAEELNISNAYLSTIFRKETGMTIKDYLIKTRLSNAKILLKTTQMQIQDIANECGFPNEHYFSTLFKQKILCSPIEYRSQWSK